MRSILPSLAALAACAAMSISAGAAPVAHHKVIRPMFITIPNNAPGHHAPVRSAGILTQWNGGFTDHLHQNITYTMVGTDPAINNASSTIPVIIIPIRMVYGKLNGNTTFDPNTTVVQNGKTVTQNLIASPLLHGRIQYIQGGVNVGKTQYIDAFQRANFWSKVKVNREYHVMLGSPTVLPVQTIKVAAQYGQTEVNPFGAGTIGTMEIDIFDQKIQGLLSNFSTEITPDTLPLFLTTDIYLTEGTGHEVCCIGGYHSALGSQPSGQTYAYATYATEPGVFSQDVSAWSHEIGEWMDDPFVDNSVNCADNTSLEDGDPLENNANYGAFPYTLNGFTYNLQSLVFLGYFGAPRNTSLRSWLSFQNDEANVCPGQ